MRTRTALRAVARHGLAALALSAVLHAPALAQWSGDLAQNTPVCVEPGTQRMPAAVPDGDGGMIVAWWDYRPGTPGLYAQRLDRFGYRQWGDGGLRIAHAVNNWSAEVAGDGAGGMVLAWSDTSGGTAPVIRAQRVSPAGLPLWGPAGVAVSSSPASALHYAARIAVGGDGAGGAAIAWPDSGERLSVQVLDAAGQRAWPAAIRPDDGKCYDTPRVVSDGAGGAIACWRTAAFGVAAQRVDAAGVPRWGAGGIVLNDPARGAYRPNVVTDGRGGAIATWLEYFPDVPRLRLMMQRLDSLGIRRWSAGASQVSAGYAESDTLLSDGAAGAFLAWMDDGLGRVQHFDPSGSPLWGPAGMPFDTSYVYRATTVLVAAPDGGVHASWYSYATHDVRVQRLSASGARLWGPAGLPLAASFIRGIAPDGLGGLLVAWEDSRNYATTNVDLYAQRWNAQGSLGVDPPAAPAAGRLSAGPVPAKRGDAVTLRFALAGAGRVRLAIHDLAGRLVRVAASGRLDAGAHAVGWDGRDASGRAVPPGLYFARLEAAGRGAVARLLVTD